MASGDDLREERLKKIDLLRDAGMEAYPISTARDTRAQDFLDTFEERESAGRVSILGGRLISRRGQGGIMFADLFDGVKVQLVLQEDVIESALFKLFADTVDTGDFIEATGTAYTTKRGEKSLKVTAWRMLAKSLAPIPDQWYGLKDEELILRERYLDILLNPDVRALFERRAKFWQSIREFLLDRSFLEAETPVLETTPGGADARPFMTHHNALDIDVSLRISLELWLKRLLVAGYPKVFEIGRIFRNEGQSREHLQDYTQLETYEAYSDMTKGMRFVQDLYRHIVKEVYGKYSFEINGHTVDFAEEWPLVDFVAEIEREFGVNAITCTEAEALDAARGARVLAEADDNKARAIDSLWKMIRKKIAGPAFLVNVPVYMEPLAKRSPTNPLIVERFQVLLAGSEMGKGFSELNDPVDQRARFEEQQALRDGGDDEAQRLDEEYVKAMEYGMPPAFGFGLSERLFSFLENRPAHETQIFPLLRPRTDAGAPAKSKQTMVATIILNEALLSEEWKKLNTAAHLSASFAAREGRKLFLHDTVLTKDGIALPLNIQHAIMVRVADDAQSLFTVMQKAASADLATVPFTEEMLQTTNDKKVAALTKELQSSEIGYVGVLVFGPKDIVDSITGSFELHS